MTQQKIKDAIQKLEAFGLVNITSALQTKRGNLAFKDPQTVARKDLNGKNMNHEYTITASGYARKWITAGPFTRAYDRLLVGYQLNKIEKVYTSERAIKWNMPDVIRVKLPGDYDKLADIVIRIAKLERAKIQ